MIERHDLYQVRIVSVRPIEGPGIRQWESSTEQQSNVQEGKNHTMIGT